jgi:hypothetical protein
MTAEHNLKLNNRLVQIIHKLQILNCKFKMSSLVLLLEVLANQCSFLSCLVFIQLFTSA